MGSKREISRFELGGEGRFQVRGDRAELTMRVDDTAREVYCATSDCALRPSDEALLSATLLPCMAAGYDYPQALALDPSLVTQLPLIQDFYRAWIPHIHSVDIPTATASTGALGPGARVGTFFSGGLDSFYTLLTHQDEITHLCFIHGADIPLDNMAFRAEVSSRIRTVARELGKEVIEVETNLRPVLDAFAPWSIGYASLLRTVAMLLEGFGKFYIPGSHYGACLWPDGSHPVLDPMWNTSRLQFVHDACEVTRFRKCELVSRHPISYEHLRVCWQNKPGTYNCCRCEKCVRTMISLQALDMLNRFPCFPRPLDLSKHFTRWMLPLHLQDLYAPTYNYIMDQGTHPELVAYLEPILFPSVWTCLYGHYSDLRRDLKHRLKRALGGQVHGH